MPHPPGWAASALPQEVTMAVYCDLIRLSNQDVRKCMVLTAEQDICRLVQQGRGDDWFDIDKAWHGIHFILNSRFSTEIEPLDFLLRGGRLLTPHNWVDIIGMELPDMRAFDSTQVKAIFMALSSISEDEFRRRYQPEVMAARQVYPGVWEEREQFVNWVLAKYLKFSTHLNYLLFHFRQLKAFLQGAVEENMGLVIKYRQ
jgi:hypothetical protein